MVHRQILLKDENSKDKIISWKGDEDTCKFSSKHVYLNYDSEAPHRTGDDGSDAKHTEFEVDEDNNRLSQKYNGLVGEIVDVCFDTDPLSVSSSESDMSIYDKIYVKFYTGDIITCSVNELTLTKDPLSTSDKK